MPAITTSSHFETIPARRLTLLIEHWANVRESLRPKALASWTIGKKTYDPLVILRDIRAKMKVGNDGIGRLDVHYKYADGAKSKGRQFATGARSLQSVCREIRHTLAHDLYHDIDMVNAHPTMLLQYCGMRGYACDSLRHYIEHREECLDELMAMKISRDDAKKVVLALTNGGIHDFRKLPDLPEWLVAYKNQVITIHELMMKDPDNKDLVKQAFDKKKRNVEGSVCNLILCDIENRALEACKAFLTSRNLPCDNLVLAFDGFMLPKTAIASIDDEWLNDLRCYVLGATGFDLEFKVKPMDEGVDLSQFDASLDAEYGKAKESFEAYVFKCLSPFSFFIHEPNDTYTQMGRETLLHRYENLKYNAYDPKSGVVEKSFVKEWLQDANMRTYQNVNRMPPPLTVPDGTFNMYAPLKWDAMAATSSSTDVMHAHMRLVMGDNEANYEYFKKLLAHILQKPGVKTGVVPCIVGGEGTGKTLMMCSIEKLVESENFMLTGNPDRDIFGRFAHNWVSKRVVVLNDYNTADTRGSNRSRLLGFVTDTQVEVEVKGVNGYKTNQHVQFFTNTNSYNPVHKTKDSRRYWIVESSARMAGNTSYFDEGWEWIENQSNIKAWYDELMAIDLTGFNVKTPPATEVESLVVAMNTCPTEMFLDDSVEAIGKEVTYKKMVNGCFQKCNKDDLEAVRCVMQRTLFDLFARWAQDPSNGVEISKFNTRKLQAELYRVRQRYGMEWKGNANHSKLSAWVLTDSCPFAMASTAIFEEDEEELSEENDD